MPDNLSAQDVSVVVQGKIEEEYIHRCLLSIRKYLPGAEIILSIWKEDLSMAKSLDYEHLVVSEDPGAFPLNKENHQMNNVNRQIVGTKQGIKAASRKYILKFRSNMSLNDDSILQFYQQHMSKADHFRQKLLALDYYTRNPRVVHLPFYLSDWILFGLSEDVRSYYNSISLQSREDGMWYEEHENLSPLFPHVFARFAPEQHIFLSWAKRIKNVDINEYFDNSKEHILLTEELLSRDFIIMNLVDSGMKFLKYSPNRYHEELTLLSTEDWQVLQNRYNKEIIDSYQWKFYCVKCYIRSFVYIFLRGGARWLVGKLGLRQVIKKIIEKN